MQLKKLTIEDKKVFSKYYEQSPAKCSFLSFANLFLWKDVENIEYFEFHNLLIVTGKSIYDGKRYFMFPIGKCMCSVIKMMLVQNFGEDFNIYGITKNDIERLNEFCSDEFVIERERDMDNYVYLSEKLINLSGKKLHSKRNHINKFKDTYNYTYERLSNENYPELLEFIEKWYEEKDGEHTLDMEKSALNNALKYYKELELKCGILKVEGNIAAFSIGEKLNDETALIHIEKADTSYNGSYAMINNEFVKNEWSDLKYINREDDMGLEGLRKAKLSYQPDVMLEMYSAHIKV